MIDTQVGNYKIVEKLGEGGMGVVYKAIDVNLDRVVAMKALNTELSGNPELEQRFRAEARAQANLNHTNLATLYALLIENNRPWMVMEFIEGENFEQMIQRRGPIPSQDAIPLFRQAMLGIGYAHRMGIVHRDIKPSNMMLDKQGIVKVMDFGIAKVLGARGMTRTGTQMGTAFYMSPEQVLNRNVDIRSDIYSLGVTLYEMLTANVPFGGNSDYQIMTDHVNTPPPPPTRFYPYIPSGVQNAVLKALEKHPDARFQTVEEFGAALEQPETFVAVAAAPVVAAAAIPAAAVPAAAASTVVEQKPAPRSLFWTPARVLIAGGLTALVLGAGTWLAVRPHPKQVAGAAPISTGGSSQVPIPSSGGELKVLEKEAVPATAVTDPAKPNHAAPQTTSPQTVHRDTSPSAKPQTVAPAVVIPAGTVIAVRMIDSVDSSRDRAGQRFDASLDLPVAVNGRTVIHKGASARVLLAGVSQAGHIEGRSGLKLQLVAITIHGKSYAVQSAAFEQQGSSRGKRSAAVIGGATAVGAAIGGIFGRKKGAAEGAVAGAGAGTATQYMTKSPPVIVEPETRIEFTLNAPVSVQQ